MHFDLRFGPVAAFVIRFNLDLLPATTAPVMYNVEVTGAARLLSRSVRVDCRVGHSEWKG
jgi:hypothetical protein